MTEALVSLSTVFLIPHKHANASKTHSTETKYSDVLWMSIRLSPEFSYSVELGSMGRFGEEC